MRNLSEKCLCHFCLRRAITCVFEATKTHFTFMINELLLRRSKDKALQQMEDIGFLHFEICLAII